MAIYGGHDITVADNLIADTLTEGGGLHAGNRFHAVPLSGTITFTGNTVVRGGSIDPRWHIGIGAVWLYALDAPITAQIELRDTTLLDSSQQALLLLGQRIDELTVKGLRVERAQSLIELRAEGHATFEGVDATDVLGAGHIQRHVPLTCGVSRIGRTQHRVAPGLELREEAIRKQHIAHFKQSETSLVFRQRPPFYSRSN